MNEREATELMSMLVVSQTGWNDIAVEATGTMMMAEWGNLEAATVGVREVVNTWTGTGRPPWGVLHGAYRTAARRLVMDQPALPSQTPGRIVPVREGRQIAARAYANACKARTPDDVHILSGWRTNEPNDRILEAWIGK